jgi:hypothetical protein
MGKTTIFYLPSLTIQNRGAGDREADRWRGEGRRRPGARRRPGSGRNEEELEGNRFCSLPWLGTDCGGRSTAGGGAARGGGRGGTGGGNGGLGKEGKMIMEVRGEVGSRFGPL